MQPHTLSFECEAGIARVTLRRPERLNALDETLIDELCAVAAAIDADQGIRAVLLTGAGRGFCAGADLAGGAIATAPPGGRGAAVGAHLRERFNPMVSAWYHLRAPLVVAVNGIAAGAGVSLALCGDIVLAARSATFAQLFAPKLGLMPDLGGSFHLTRLVGSARAKGLALLGDPLSAADAAAWGLIWGCVEDADLQADALRVAQRLAEGPTAAYQRIKAVFNDATARTFDQQLAIEADMQTELGDSADFAEGLRAFRDKRPPRFQGR